MLAAVNRLTSSAAFGEAVRRGKRAGAGVVVVHLQVSSDSHPPRVGFVVSKQVGNAVTRNTVKRRLRHLARERLDALPGGAVLVVRALPDSAAASYDVLAKDLDRALGRAAGQLSGAAR